MCEKRVNAFSAFEIFLHKNLLENLSVLKFSLVGIT